MRSPSALPLQENNAFDEELGRRGLALLVRGPVTTLQVNVGKFCNQACHHCHVGAGPNRTERMAEETAGKVVRLLEASPSVTTLDLTGGAPELHEVFRPLVREARRLGRRVIDRCNLTVLSVPGQEDLAEFLAGNGVEVVASLPCYTRENVEAQRGRGVFEPSIEALRCLNDLGYAWDGSDLTLDLVYNPVGTYLPGSESELEQDYREALGQNYGITFDHLFTITNMPIARFADQLARAGDYDAYMGLLANHFNPKAVEGVMCRSLVSVGWDGALYDCDFNQMLETPLLLRGRPACLDAIDSLQELEGLPIATGDHCFGCTAGCGSSCTGALVE
jgi:radical SAM/Cys-rich protein